MNKKSPFKLLVKETYFTMIRNSCGADLWRHNYALVKGSKCDLVQNGKKSCAFFVSSILKMFDLISGLHTTVLGVEKDLKQNGWQEIPISSKIPKGSILVWEKQRGHYHIGFYLGKEEAISNSQMKKCPLLHDWTFHKKRKIIRAYQHHFLQ